MSISVVQNNDEIVISSGGKSLWINCRTGLRGIIPDGWRLNASQGENCTYSDIDFSKPFISYSKSQTTINGFRTFVHVGFSDGCTAVIHAYDQV